MSPYSDRFGGLVLNATVSLSTHCHVQPSKDGSVHLRATDARRCAQLTGHPTQDKAAERLLPLHVAALRRISRMYLGGETPPVIVTSYSDAPPGSGVGSSSSLVVCMVAALAEYFGIVLGEYDIARTAYEIERIDCGMAGGKQDQYATAFGGFNFMEFGRDDRVIVNPLRIKRDVVNELESSLLLYYTGRSRESAAIIKAQIASTQRNETDALTAMHAIRQKATETKEALLKGDIPLVLDLLGQSWTSKKRLALGVSNRFIDSVASRAIEAGARAVKISGAGGGGFMMIGARPEDRYDIIAALDGLGGRFFPFRFVQEGVESWKSR